MKARPSIDILSYCVISLISQATVNHGESLEAEFTKSCSKNVTISSRQGIQPQEKYIPLKANELKPFRYEILFDLTHDLEMFSGEVNVFVEIVRSTSRFKIQANSLSISKVNVRLIGSSKKIVVKRHWQHKSDIYIIETETEISAGGWVTNQLEYTGLIRATSNRSDTGILYHKSPKHPSKITLMTKFEPNGARKAFPCFDEPDMKARFKVNIKHKIGVNAYSNMPLEKTQTINGSTLSSFEESHLMATYLVAFAVCDCLRTFTHTKRGVEIGLIYFQEDLNECEYTLETVVKLFKYYEHYLGIPYNFPKLDIFATPDYPIGGMEHSGLIIQKRNYTFYRKYYGNDIQAKRKLLNLTSHEISHQWFGNLVTIKSWEHIWLKEGIATLFEYKAIVDVEPSIKAEDRFLVEGYKKAMDADVSGQYELSDTVIPRIVYQSDLTKVFDLLMIYYKGANILRMMEGFLGEKGLRKVFQNYLQINAESNVETYDFIRAVEKVYNKVDMKVFIDSWTKQSGVPIITVTQTAEGRYRFRRMSSLSVEGSCLSKSERRPHRKSMKHHRKGSRIWRNRSGHRAIWSIPLSYKTSKDTRGMFWLTRRQQRLVFSDNPEWILFNTDNKGYYVVNYTNEIWNWLIDALKHSRSFDPGDYVRFLFDSYYLAELRCIDYSIYSRILTMVKGNPRLSHIDWTCFPDTFLNLRGNCSSKA